MTLAAFSPENSAGRLLNIGEVGPTDDGIMGKLCPLIEGAPGLVMVFVAPLVCVPVSVVPG